MKKIIVTIVALIAVMMLATACTSKPVSEKTPEDTLVEKVLAEYVETYHPGATVSEESQVETFNGGLGEEECRVWNATLNGVEFRIRVPLWALETEDEAEIDLMFEDSYAYNASKDVLKNFPELGEVQDIEFDISVTTSVKASETDVAALWESYQKARAALKDVGVENYFADIVVDENNTVEFTPFDNVRPE